MNNKKIITDLLIRSYCDNVCLRCFVSGGAKQILEDVIKLQQNILQEGLEYGINFMNFDNIIKYDVMENMRNEQ